MVKEFSRAAAKLLGVYFVVVGFAHLVIAINGVVMRTVRPDIGSENVGDFLPHIWTFAQPAVYLGAAALLILKTDWILKMLKVHHDDKAT